ncbi:MAG: type II toxin-antitoxin system HipA family toxin [Proteobacteria bacterium]|jgi:serine/threonine-protein kinase HipA|nr:type II toxin-antitoxin system HipA family toxin [Pseudomonadota bacterium]MDA1299699.1 type II toxin-antitoxin system HipA family toxin [Pseudomonadota bacterium]
MSEQLDVWVSGTRVGRLTQENYEYFFQYDDIAGLESDRHLVSLTMPVRVRQYETMVLMPPFQTSLPEGALLENLRSSFSKVMDIYNDMVLLGLVGNNTIGRVRFSQPDKPVEEIKEASESLSDLLTYPETEELFVDLLERFSIQSGVSGVQPKVLWSEQGKKITLPHENYILKSAGRDFPGLAVNEFFCLTAANKAGLKTPEFYLSDNGKLLIVKRFDVTEDGKALAFEETCALLNRPNHGKYTGSYAEVVDIIQKVPCVPVGETNRDLFKAIAFSMLIRNGDAHLKNFGITYDKATEVSLAPFYDLVNTTIYLPKDQPALTFNGTKTWPTDESLTAFGLGVCGLRKKETRRLLDELKTGISASLADIEQYGRDNPQYETLCKGLTKVYQS